MIFDLEGETRDFETNYRKEYRPKKIRKSLKAVLFAPEYIQANPITESYREHINTQKENDRLPFCKRTESAAEYLNKMRSESPHLMRILPDNPPNEAIVERDKRKLLRSVYQLEIARTLADDRDSHDEQRSDKILLSQHHSIPETVQKKSFRDPRHYGTSNQLRSNAFTKPFDNLAVNEKEREILRVRTGDTEYQGVIGKVGRQIVEEQFFGPPLAIDPPKDIAGDPDSPRSVCSNILKSISKNPISQIY